MNIDNSVPLSSQSPSLNCTKAYGLFATSALNLPFPQRREERLFTANEAAKWLEYFQAFC